MVAARAKKLLALALHSGTGEGEASAAMRMFRSEVDRLGGVDALFGTGSGGPKQPFIPMSKKMEMITELETIIRVKEEKIDGLETEVTRLVQDNEKLRLENEALRAASRKAIRTDTDGRMTYEDFAKQATTRLNDYQSWQINFQRQTGISRSKMALWRQRGWVDSDAVDWLSKLKPAKVQARHMSGWTIQEVNRLRRLINIGKSEKEIAEKLSEEFGRLVTENNIKSLKTQSRQRTGVFKNEAYGPPIGKSRKAETAGDGDHAVEQRDAA